MVYLPVMRHDNMKLSDKMISQERQYDDRDYQMTEISCIYKVCLILINVMS